MDTENEKSQLESRISLLKVPIDIVPEDALEEMVYNLIKTKKAQNVILLSIWDLLRARRNNEYRSLVLGAAMVIPISKSLVGGARFLTQKTPVRYMPFNFVIQLLTILEKREFSVYLLGGKKSVLLKTEKNIRQTFPRLHIVGRYIGKFHPREEAVIFEAIRKAGPSLLLIGKGVRGREKWLARHTRHLNSGLRLWCSDLFDVFAERRKRPSAGVFKRGLEWVGFCFRNPLRIFKIVSFFYYNFLLLIYRLFVK